MGQCKCSVPSVEEEVSAQHFRALDTNKNNMACHAEMAKYVASRPEMWAMLGVNLDLPEDVCQATATRVVMELASGLKGNLAAGKEITEAQFHAFRCRYMLDGKGAQEFFHRCVFASFDANSDQSLDAEELETFLDTFYKSGSIFEGDARLPPKQELLQRILDNSVGYKKEGKLTFEEIRDLIRGNTSSAKPNAMSNSAAPATSPLQPTSRLLPKPMAVNGNKAQAAVSELAPEDTPEPNLARPSMEFSPSVPEHTPEVQPFGGTPDNKQTPEVQSSGSLEEKLSKLASAHERKPRPRNSTPGDRPNSRSRSPSARAQRIKSSSRSPSARPTTRTTRSKSPSATAGNNNNNRSKSPSARARRTSSRSSGGDELKSNGGIRSMSPTTKARSRSSRQSGGEQLTVSCHGGTRSKSPSARKERRSIRQSRSFDECIVTGDANTQRRLPAQPSRRPSSKSPTNFPLPPPPL